MKKLSLVMAVLFCLLTVFSVTSAASTDYTYLDVSEHSHEITLSGRYNITGSTQTNSISVTNGTQAYITLNNATIDLRGSSMPAIYVEPGSTLYLTLTGTNYLYGGSDGDSKYGYAGISAGYNYETGLSAELYIDGDGTTYVYGWSGGTNATKGGPAGIGGDANCCNGYIEINSGTIYAYGGVPVWQQGGAGIGTGGCATQYGTFGLSPVAIKIDGGNVYAYGGNEAAGIGGGSNTDGGIISIYGGNVTAEGGSDNSPAAGWSGAGIGGGENAGGSYITIKGGNVSATGGRCSAGIGTAHNGYSSTKDTSIAIGGNAVVNAVGGSGKEGQPQTAAAGIGTGSIGSDDNTTIDIIIGENASVTAFGGSETADDIGSSSKNNDDYMVLNIIIGTGRVDYNTTVVPAITQKYNSKINILTENILSNLEINANETYIVPICNTVELHNGATVRLYEGGKLIIYGNLTNAPDSNSLASGIIIYGGELSGCGVEDYDITTVTGQIFNVFLPSAAGYQVIEAYAPTYGSSAKICEGKALYFRVLTNSEYNSAKMKVKVNSIEVFPDSNGVYTVSTPNNSMQITVSGVTEIDANNSSGENDNNFGNNAQISSSFLQPLIDFFQKLIETLQNLFNF